MPTTNTEAGRILQICLKYLTQPQDILKFTRDLHEQVGQKSDNWSVRETMRMLYDHAIDRALAMCPKGVTQADFMNQLLGYASNPPGPPEPKPPEVLSSDFSYPFWVVLLWSIIVGHVMLWLSLVTCGILSLLYQPLYVAMPIISFCVYLVATTRECPVTRWENLIRKKLGWRKVTTFLHWYFICPLLHGRACDRKCVS